MALDYGVDPVIEIWTLKLVTSTMLDETVNVITAAVEAPGAIVELVGFQVIVM